MAGRRWVIIGVVVGVALAIGHLPYLVGAARSLSDTALRLVGSGGSHLVRDAASHGAPRRVVIGATALVAVVAPGLTALLLIVAALGTLRLRAVVAVILVALGAAAFIYHPKGIATGVIVLALAVAGIAVAAAGPLAAAPMAALAGLIGATYLPRLLSHASVERGVVELAHEALFNRPGDPLALKLGLVVVAAVPFAAALRLVLRR